MLPFLLKVRQLLRHMALGVGAAVLSAIVLRAVGVLSRADTGRVAEFVVPIVSTLGLFYFWAEAAVAGVDPESPYHVPGAPPFRLTLFALFGLSALWHSLGNVAHLADWSGEAWLTRKLAIAGVGLGIAGGLMLLDAWRHRRARHPRAPWRRTLAGLGGLLAVLIALPWEPLFPTTARLIKPWLYGGLALGATVGLIRGWWPDWSRDVASHDVIWERHDHRSR